MSYMSDFFKVLRILVFYFNMEPRLKNEIKLFQRISDPSRCHWSPICQLSRQNRSVNSSRVTSWSCECDELTGSLRGWVLRPLRLH